MSIFIWNDIGGTKVSKQVSSEFRYGVLILSGTGVCKDRFFQYEACTTPKGWGVTIFTEIGRIGDYTGTTFNLQLEVVTAARRLL